MGRKRRQASSAVEIPTPHWEPLARPTFSRWQQASIVARHLVPLAFLWWFGGSLPQFVLLHVFNLAFTIAGIATVGVAVSTRQEVAPRGTADRVGSWIMLALVCAGVSLMLTALFGWVIAFFVATEGRGFWDPNLWWSVLAIVATALPGMYMAFEEDLRVGLSEEARKRRDQPVVGVHLFSALFVVLPAMFALHWGRFGAVLLAVLITALFIFRDLRPDLARALSH
ncbi:MAG: hypothetical protein ABIW30_06840 [Arenimonas sp.]